MRQRALRQQLHALVADEAQKIAESIVGMAAFLVEQVEQTELDRREAEQPQSAPLVLPEGVAAPPPDAQDAEAVDRALADASAPQSAATDLLMPAPEVPPDGCHDAPPASPQVWEVRQPTPDPQAAAPIAAGDTAAPPPHWLQRVSCQPPAHWVERVRQSAPDLLPSLTIARMPEALHAPPEAAVSTQAELAPATAPATHVACDPQDIDAPAAYDAPGHRLAEAPRPSPALEAAPTPWPELLPEAPAHVPESRDAMWRAWAHEQKLKREQEGRRWNA